MLDVEEKKNQIHKQGVEEGLLQAAKNMLREGTDISTIIKVTGLTEEQIGKIE